MTATDATPTTRERLTAVLRGCDAPASTAYLAAALGAAGRMRRLTVWKTLRRMEDLGEVARVTAARCPSSPGHPNLSHTPVSWRLT